MGDMNQAKVNGTSAVNGESTTPQAHADTDIATSQAQSASLRSPSGWDGKLRHPSATPNRTATLANPEALSDPEYSDPDAPPIDQIEADEDLLDDEDLLTEDVDLVHCRISSIPALHLERFARLKRLCLRQNAIQKIDFPEALARTLEELDLYDNLIKEIHRLDDFTVLKTLDLSFNKIKHIRNMPPSPHLKELYFVQNRITKIENLTNLPELTTLELAANRIREIENLEALAALTDLWLGKNKITEIRNLEPLGQTLRLLDLKSNRLTAISGLSALPNLEELYVSHNAITEISPSSLADNLKLRVLDISNNRISKLENLSHLTELEEFWASSNEFTDFGEVEAQLRNKDKLETVYLEGNPLQSRQGATYRNKVRLALPQVKQIDATFVRV